MQLLPLTNAQRCQRFGKFDYLRDPQKGNPEAILIDREWVRQNIVRVDIPQLGRIKEPRLPTVSVHRAAAKSIVELWARWEKLGLLQHVQTWNGSFVPRFKRGRAGGGVAALSNHSWGTAFDVNAKLYPLGQPVWLLSPMRALAKVGEELGWFWGGNFRSRPDGMHFEFTGEVK